MNMSFLTIGAKYTRPDLAAAWGYESHHAISRGVVTPQGEKVIILFVTRLKQEALTQYADYLSGDLLFSLRIPRLEAFPNASMPCSDRR